MHCATCITSSQEMHALCDVTCIASALCKNAPSGSHWDRDSAHTCCACCPKVISSTHTYNPGLGYLDLISPYGVCLVILLIHAHPYALWWQLEYLCAQYSLGALYAGDKAKSWAHKVCSLGERDSSCVGYCAAHSDKVSKLALYGRLHAMRR